MSPNAREPRRPGDRGRARRRAPRRGRARRRPRRPPVDFARRQVARVQEPARRGERQQPLRQPRLEPLRLLAGRAPRVRASTRSRGSAAAASGPSTAASGAAWRRPRAATRSCSTRCSRPGSWASRCSRRASAPSGRPRPPCGSLAGAGRARRVHVLRRPRVRGLDLDVPLARHDRVRACGRGALVRRGIRLPVPRRSRPASAVALGGARRGPRACSRTGSSTRARGRRPSALATARRLDPWAVEPWLAELSFATTPARARSTRCAGRWSRTGARPRCASLLGQALWPRARRAEGARSSRTPSARPAQRPARAAPPAPVGARR